MKMKEIIILKPNIKILKNKVMKILKKNDDYTYNELFINNINIIKEISSYIKDHNLNEVTLSYKEELELINDVIYKEKFYKRKYEEFKNKPENNNLSDDKIKKNIEINYVMMKQKNTKIQIKKTLKNTQKKK